MGQENVLQCTRLERMCITNNSTVLTVQMKVNLLVGISFLLDDNLRYHLTLHLRDKDWPRRQKNLFVATQSINVTIKPNNRILSWMLRFFHLKRNEILKPYPQFMHVCLQPVLHGGHVPPTPHIHSPHQPCFSAPCFPAFPKDSSKCSTWFQHLGVK